MPAVTFFVYTLGSAVASLFGIIGTAASLAIGSATLALGVAGIRRASQLKDTGEINRPSGTTVSVRSTEIPAIIAFGEVQVGGVLTYLNSTGVELRELYHEIVHTGHEIDSFIGWYLDDKYIPVADVDTAGDGSVDGNTGAHGLDDVSGTPTLYLRGALGTDSQAVDSMLDSAFSDIDSNHRHRGCARSIVRCDLLAGSEEKWDGGRPPQSITAVLRAIKAYDPRLDSTFPSGSGAHRLATPSTWAWTDNPALIWARYRILAAPLGPGWATDRINWQSVFDAANVCDATVAIPTSATEKRFRCDLATDSAVEPREVIAKILATMAGRERHFNGLWHVYAAAFPSTDFALTDDDLIGELQYRKQPEVSERYNQVKGSFVDRERLWKRVQFVSVNNTTLRTNRDNGKVLPLELDLDGVTREYQAQRLAMHALNHADDTGVLIFPTGYNGLNIRVGDTGTVTLSEFGWSAKTFRCVATRFVEFQGMELTLKEDASGNYSDPAEGAYSTRTAAGDIVFGTVTPWYLQGSQSTPWTARLINVTRNGQTFTKTGGADNTWGDATVYSVEGYARLHVGFTAVATNKDLVVGYDSNPAADHSWDTIDACWNLTSAGNANIIESGTTVVSDGAFAAGDRFEIVRDYNTVRYYKNGVIKRNIGITPTAGLRYLDSSFHDLSASVADLTFGPITNVNTGQMDPNAAEVLVSSQPADGTEVIPSISYSGGGTLVDYSPITSVSWENDLGESIDVVLRQSARVQLSASDSLIGRKLAMRWSLNGGSSWSYDGTNTDNVNITAADWQPKSTQRTVTVADGETIDVESIVVLIIPDPTSGDPADVQYRGLSLSVEAKLR